MKNPIKGLIGPCERNIRSVFRNRQTFAILTISTAFSTVVPFIILGPPIKVRVDYVAEFAKNFDSSGIRQWAVDLIALSNLMVSRGP